MCNSLLSQVATLLVHLIFNNLKTVLLIMLWSLKLISTFPKKNMVGKDSGPSSLDVWFSIMLKLMLNVLSI